MLCMYVFLRRAPVAGRARERRLLRAVDGRVHLAERDGRSGPQILLLLLIIIIILINTNDNDNDNTTTTNNTTTNKNINDDNNNKP